MLIDPFWGKHGRAYSQPSQCLTTTKSDKSPDKVERLGRITLLRFVGNHHSITSYLYTLLFTLAALAFDLSLVRL